MMPSLIISKKGETDLTEEKRMEEDLVAPPGGEVVEEIDEEEEALPTEKTDSTVSQEEYDSLHTQYVRLLADFDNFKRRTQNEKADLLAYSNAELVRNILPILDAFDLAFVATEQEEDEKVLAFCEGMEKVQKQLQDVLGKAGLSVIEAQAGTSYDPTYHEAIMMVEEDSLPAQSIAEVLRTGYSFKDKVLRPTVCKVVQG